LRERDDLQATAGRDLGGSQVTRGDHLAGGEGLANDEHLLSTSKVQRSVGKGQCGAEHQKHADHDERQLAATPSNGLPGDRLGTPGYSLTVGAAFRCGRHHRFAFL
jgi:hypothetical protein